MPHAPFRLRRATPLDAAAVSRVLAASYSALLAHHYPPDVLEAALPLMTNANPARLSSGRYYLVESQGGEPVSVGGWSVEAPGTGEQQEGLAHIRHVATHPEWLGQGAAALILSQAITRAAAEGFQQLSCMSTRGAVPFYARFGFAPVGDVLIDMGTGIPFPATEMQRCPEN